MKLTLRKIAFGILATSLSISSYAQTPKQRPPSSDYSKFHLGLGIGMDYGGLGFKAEYLPVKYLGIFGGIGYNFKDPGLNAGIHFRPPS